MFGLAHIKKEGAPLHPDELDVGDCSEEEYEKWYRRQLEAYYDAFPHLPRLPPYFDENVPLRGTGEV